MKNNKNSGIIKYIFAGVLFLIIITMISIMIYSSYYKDFGKTGLSKNNKDIFGISDLVIDDVKFGSTYNDVIFEFGSPKKTEEKTVDSYNYKILYYDGLTITMKEDYNDLILVKAEITSKKYVTSRNIKVGNKITKLFKNYKIANSNGTYLYGNYTNNALNETEITGNIYFGYRTSESVTYVNRESVIDGHPTNIAILEVMYKKGKINKITWSYDIK